MRIAKQNGTPEIFYTIQGEGRNIGEPAIFLRTSECNLQCVWCDTPYTWNFDGTPYIHEEYKKYKREDEQTIITVGEAIDLVTQEQHNHLVVSGGEPMLQQQDILELAQGLKAENPTYRVDIETNGTVMPSDELIQAIDLFSVSPKMDNSGNSPEKRYRPNVIQKFAETENADFKFVVQSQIDVPEILSMFNTHKIPPERVYLMPEGRTKDALDQSSQLVAELAKHYQFNFTPRLHIELWGDERGV